MSTVGNTVTFKPATSIAAMRVQITSNTGNQLYNSGWMSGFDAGLDALSWQALDDKGAPLPAGLYLTLVEVRGTDGTTKTESGSLQLEAAPMTARSDIEPRATTITGAGTTNRLALWTSASTLGDSIVTQTSGSALSIAGSLTVTGTITTKTVNATNNNGNALVGNSKSGTALAGITQTGNGVLGTSTSANGMRGVTGTGIGVRGDSNNGTIGVQGNSNAAFDDGTPVGVDGNANGGVTSIGVRGTSNEGKGVYGKSTSGFGVLGESNSTSGVYGGSTSGTGVNGASSSGTGVSGTTFSTADNATAVSGTIPSVSPGSGSAGVSGVNKGTTGNGYGVYGSHAGFGIGVYGTSNKGDGVYGSSTDGAGVSGTSTNSHGVVGTTNNANGFRAGVRGTHSASGSAGAGVYGEHLGGGIGVYGYSTSGYSIFGDGAGTNSYAGYFNGRVRITGNLQVDGTISKGGGSFRIDDPLDPANKYLYHSFVESPDMMNIYNGAVTLDKQGRATITMPTYFSALNRDFRYQLTCIGGWSPVYVARKISGNTWQIAGGKAGMEVSWQVTGVRRDPWANDHRIPTQQLKTGTERGRYLYPAGYHQPESLGIDHLVAKPKLPESGVQVVFKPAIKRFEAPRVAQAQK